MINEACLHLEILHVGVEAPLPCGAQHSEDVLPGVRVDQEQEAVYCMVLYRNALYCTVPVVGLLQHEQVEVIPVDRVPAPVVLGVLGEGEGQHAQHPPVFL